MSTTTDHPRQSSDPGHRFPVRRVSFADTLARLDRGFMAHGDVVVCHGVATLSGLFPDGEEMFVASVRKQRDKVTDSDLRQQVNAFIGQESMHSREHRMLNARLAELGYRAQLIEELFYHPEQLGWVARNAIKLLERFGPFQGQTPPGDEDGAPAAGDGPLGPDGLPVGVDPMYMLALTAALEHYTATLAEILLTEAAVQRAFEDDGLFRMWAWHAIEECEHKSVAFDVFRAAGGDEATRQKAMREARLALTLMTGHQVVAGVLRDPATYRRGGLGASARRLWRHRRLTRRVWTRLQDYKRPDFHPSDHDTTGLEGAWRAWFDDGAERPRPRAA